MKCCFPFILLMHTFCTITTIGKISHLLHLILSYFIKEHNHIKSLILLGIVSYITHIAKP